MAGIKVPQVSEADMRSFHDAHFLQGSTEHFTAHFLRPDEASQQHGAPANEEDKYIEEEEEEEDDGLGYYHDGVKRTLTDEQIAIFRHSELEALRRSRESTKIRKATVPETEASEEGELSEGELSSSTRSAAAKKKKKKRRRNNKNKVDEEPVDLRKRTWDVVESGLATLDYGEEENEQPMQGNASQRRRIARKCDKGLPSCGLCFRLRKPCDYTDVSAAAAPPKAEDITSLQARLSDLEAELRASRGGNVNSSSLTPNSNGWSATLSPESTAQWTTSFSQSRFPAALFLDIDCFKYASLPIPPASVPVPPAVLSILSNTHTVQAAVATYFSTIHAWFPFISRKRLTIGTSLWEGGPDVAMLFLGMMLVCSEPGGEGGEGLYVAARGFLGSLVDAGCVSLGLLQGMVLVAVWEVGMGAYPAAWMRVAECARYAEMLGIPGFKESAGVLGGCSTWTEVEERRRVWWAVYVLDRAVSLGNKKRFVMPEVDEGALLPVDDEAWDDGDPSRGRQIPIDTPQSEPQGGFTRLAQAAMLVSKTMTHCRKTVRNHQRNVPDPFSLDDVTSLLDTLVSFSHTLRSELPKARRDATCFPTPRPHSLGLTSPPITSAPTPTNFPFNTQFNNDDDIPPSRRDPFPFGTSTLKGLPTATATTNSPPSSLSPNSNSNPPPPQTPCLAYFSLLPARALTLSSLILLLDIYSCPENLHDGPGPLGSSSMTPASPQQNEMQSRAVSGLRETALATRDFALEILDAAMLPSGVECVSPLVLDALYGAMATLHWLWKEGGDGQTQRDMEDIRRCMARLGERWRVAGKYVDMLHYHDVTAVMAWKGIAP
ncbi:hypothetical protein B0T16DRAFT_452108 [Cercophora newfieldiana]|uniref:Xylanolytic transcriptional activator regulatory domain-containing protein n=1 Tax=Cercophora newfieldiana TaxID=92897 RepID=A0AA39YSC2_9PEZI|nr:hypothetical protein B0T16DRAFT_452108 [Cercophora newfieldiana]